MPEFSRPLLIILWVRVYWCQRHFVCLFGEHSYLQEYVGYGICDFLEFGWPVGFDCSRPLPIHTNFHNHKGATEFPAAVDAYLSSEHAHHAVIGPFSHNPFSCPVVMSPLKSVPKPNNTEQQIILHLRWSVGSSVNNGIPSALVCSCLSYGGPDCQSSGGSGSWVFTV